MKKKARSTKSTGKVARKTTSRTKTASRTPSRRSQARPAARPRKSREAMVSWKRILVPVDFSDPSKRALRHALSLARACRGRITALHVVEPIVYPVETGFASLTAEAITPEAVKATGRKLRTWVGELVPAGMLDKPLVRVGRPFDEIVITATEWKADLIVVSTHGYTGIKHVLLGSTAERVVRHAPCPVLTVRRPD